MFASTKINKKSKHLSWIKKSFPFLKGTRILRWNNLMPIPPQQCFSTFFVCICTLYATLQSFLSVTLIGQNDSQLGGFRVGEQV